MTTNPTSIHEDTGSIPGPAWGVKDLGVKDLNIRLDIVKLLEENIGPRLSDINYSNIFSDPPPGVMTVKKNK